MPIVDFQVKLSKGVKAFKCYVALQRRQTLDRGPNKAVFKRLGECESILNERSGNGSPRSESSDSNNAPVPISESRDDVLDGEVEFVQVAGAGLHTGYGPGELSVLWVV